jgi:hypothetical protein
VLAVVFAFLFFSLQLVLSGLRSQWLDTSGWGCCNSCLGPVLSSPAYEIHVQARVGKKNCELRLLGLKHGS